MMTSPLRNRCFRRLYLAQLGALTGTGLSTIALALLAREMSGERATVVLGTALALKMVAYVAVAPVATALLGHRPRKRWLSLLDLGRAALVCLIPFATQAMELYLLILLLSTASAAFKPLLQSSVADALPDEEQYTRALSMIRVAYDLENLLSPMLGAALLLVLPFDVLFGLNGALFLLSAAFILRSGLQQPLGEHGAPSAPANARAGFTTYLQTPRLRSLGALSLSVAAVGAMVIVNTASLVGQLGQNDSAVAIAMAAFGLGSLTVVSLLPRLLQHWGERGVMRVGVVLATAALLAGLIGPSFPGVLGIWLIAGAGSAAVQTLSGRLLRRSAEPARQSSLFATHFSLSHLCWLLCYPLAGGLYAHSPALAFGGLAALSVAGLGLSLVTWGAADEGPIFHEHDALEHQHGSDHDHHHLVVPTQRGTAGLPHRHAAFSHSHPIVIDAHHPVWPRPRRARTSS